MSLIDRLFERVHAPRRVPAATHTQATVTSTASTLTTLSAPAVTGANGYLVQVTGTGAVVRFCIDGATSPTTTKGFRAVSGDRLLLTPEDHSSTKFILESGTPVLEIQAVL